MAKPKSKDLRLTAAQKKELTSLFGEVDQHADKLARQLAAVLSTTAAADKSRSAATSAAGWDPDAVVKRALAASELHQDQDSTPSAFRVGLRKLWHHNFDHDRASSPAWPWLIAGSLFAAACLAWLVGIAGVTGLLGGPIGYAATVGGLLTLFGGVIAGIGPARRKLLGWLPAGWTAWLIGAVVDGLVWLGLVAGEGMTALRFCWWLVSTVAFGARWWSYVRAPYPSGPSEPRPVDDATAAARVLERFYKYLACPNGPLAGAELVGLHAYQHGLRGVLQLVPGKQSLATVMQAKPKISTALDYYDDEIVIEHNRTRKDAKPSELDIQIVTKSPIKNTIYFDVPVYCDGKILLGPYADGIGQAQYTLYSPGGIRSGYILGSTSSGKSRLIETIALTAMVETPTVLIYLDGQEGASSHLLWDHALWRGGPEQAREIQASLLKIIRARQRYNRYRKWTGFRPAPDWPGIFVIVDECQDIFTINPLLWAKIARTGRKVGAAILAASQVTTLDAFGGSDALRSSLVAGNAIAMRTASDVQSQIFPGLKVDLTELPGHLPGYAYTTSQDGSTRTAPFRGRKLLYTDDLADLAKPPADVRTAEDWFANLPAQQLDPISEKAAGPAFANRHQVAADEDAELERMFADITNLDDLLAAIDADDAATNTGSESPAEVHDVVTGPGGAPAVVFPEFIPVSHTTGRPAAPAGLTTAQEAAFDAITGGAATPSEVGNAIAASKQRAHTLLTQLVDKGHLTTDGRGRYHLALTANR